MQWHTAMRNENEFLYRLCHGRLYVNDEEVVLNEHVYRIAMASIGLKDQDEPCEEIPPRLAERILHMERSLSLSALEQELGGVLA